jgi:putative ABC transport system ATP-binding protein
MLEGPSGSGKTTLLAIAAGLLSLDEGDVVLAGQSLRSLNVAAQRRCRAHHVGFVFQRPNLLDQLSARRNVILAALLAGAEENAAEHRAAELFEALGIAGLGDRHPGELSAGQEQRVAVARALVHRPSIVLADEPTANLDWAAGRAVAERLKTLAREQRSAVLMATHDMRLETFADRKIRLEDGTLR